MILVLMAVLAGFAGFLEAGDFNRFSKGREAGPLYPVRVNNLKGYVDEHGKVVVAPTYRTANDFSEDRALVVREAGSAQYIDGTGTTVTNADFSNGSDSSEGLSAVKKGGLWVFIDRSGAIRIAPQYTDAGDFHNGLAKFQSGKRYGFLDTTGRIAIPA